MRQQTKTKKRVATAIAIVLIGFTGVNSVKIIPTGYSGVPVIMGQVQNTTLNSGIHFKIPFTESVKLISTKQQDITFSDKIWSETSNRTAVYYEGVTVTYTINPSSANWIVSHVSNYREGIVSSPLVASGIKTASKSFVDTDATNRGKIEPAAMTAIQKSIDAKYGTEVITINRVVINDADFSDSYNQALADKQKAQISADTQEIQNKQAIAKAQADAEVKRTNAQADAEAKKIAAQAEAEANQKISNSITSNILENKKLEKWDGKLPLYEGSGTSSVIINPTTTQN